MDLETVIILTDPLLSGVYNIITHRLNLCNLAWRMSFRVRVLILALLVREPLYLRSLISSTPQNCDYNEDYE
jgi:hypothetical protein